LDRNLALELVRVTEAAALASARFFGKGDPSKADQAAVEAMELAFKGVKVSGHIVIGEEPVDERARLCPGDTVGAGGEAEFDIAVDPVDCIEALADGQSNSVSAIAMGERGAFLKLPAPLMRILCVGPEAADAIDLNAPVFDTLVRIAEAKRVYVEDLTVSILDRERHRKLVEEVRKAGARIQLLKDGELAAAMSAALPGTGIDVMMGVGEAKPGMIAAAALACIGAGFQARFVPDANADPENIPPEFKKIYRPPDLVGSGNIMFAATGVSHSDFLDGVMFRPGGAITHSVVFRRKSGTIRFLKTEHFFEKTPDYT
jgi:fructose-1,6-bisphosphatase II